MSRGSGAEYDRHVTIFSPEGRLSEVVWPSIPSLVIPDDVEVIRSTNRGFLLVLNNPPTRAGLTFEQAAWRLIEQDTMKVVMVEEEPKKRGFFSFFGG